MLVIDLMEKQILFAFIASPPREMTEMYSCRNPLKNRVRTDFVTRGGKGDRAPNGEKLCDVRSLISDE